MLGVCSCEQRWMMKTVRGGGWSVWMRWPHWRNSSLTWRSSKFTQPQPAVNSCKPPEMVQPSVNSLCLMAGRLYRLYTDYIQITADDQTPTRQVTDNFNLKSSAKYSGAKWTVNKSKDPQCTSSDNSPLTRHIYVCSSLSQQKIQVLLTVNWLCQ